MVYLCGDNNLESSAVIDLREMKSVGTTAGLNVVAQFDRYHKGMPTRRYLLRRGTSLRRELLLQLLHSLRGKKVALSSRLQSLVSLMV